MKLPSVKSLRSLKGKKVLLRLTLNVPINNKVIQNDFRLKRIIPTLKFLHEKKAKTIIISHIGSDGKESLRRVVRYLNKHLEVGYLPDIDSERRNMLIDNMKDGSIFVVDNIRRYKEEKENDKDFAKDLATVADVYVNEDFAVSHRKHASVVGLPKYLPSYFGPLFLEEIEELSKAFKPKKPFVVILGGAKFKAKLPLVKTFLKKADKIFITGALANSFFNEMGYETGLSLVDDEKLSLKTLSKNKKIFLPHDVVVKNRGDVSVKSPDKLTKKDMMVDVGPETIEMIKDEIEDAGMILWNGPLGKFEMGHGGATEKIAKTIARSHAHTIVGGGDSISAIQKLGILKKFNFVSTGGGAMLTFLAERSLPGIDAVKKSKRK